MQPVQGNLLQGAIKKMATAWKSL